MTDQEEINATAEKLEALDGALATFATVDAPPNDRVSPMQST